MSILIGLLVLSFLIFFHELGHFLAARFFGVKVERFSIGFGKVIIKKEWAGTEWAISAIPLGGYVQMKGQEDLDPLKRSSDPDSYSSKKPWQRIIILLAGPLANFILAFILYFIIALIGFNDVGTKIGKVLPNSPAIYAGIKEGDIILAINNHKIKSWRELSDIIQNSSTLNLKVKRGDKTLNLVLKPETMETKNIFGENIKRPMIGISPAPYFININYSFFDALKFAWNKTIEASMLIIKSIQKMIEGVIPAKEIGGVITIMDITAKASEVGFVALLSFTALISVNLGVLNLLPIPALDGGHIIFNLYELITNKAPNDEVVYKLTIAGWVFLISLMGFGLYNDINRLLGVSGG